MKKFLFLLAALLFLSACGEEPALPSSATTEPTPEAPPPVTVDRSLVIGTWQGSASNSGTFLILDEDGTGAILSLVPADGDAFTEDFYLGYPIAWQLSEDTLSCQVLPTALPDGSLYVPDSEPFEKTVDPDSGILVLLDNETTEFFIRAEKPVWLSVSDYAKTLADWLIGPDHPDAASLYAEFYAAFAAHD